MKYNNIENHYATDNLPQWITESIAEWEAVIRTGQHRPGIPEWAASVIKKLKQELLVVRGIRG